MERGPQGRRFQREGDRARRLEDLRERFRARRGERADKVKAMNLFGRFVSRSVVDHIWKDRDLFMDGDRPRPQRITVTVMLTDLTGYTTASEKKEPAEVMDWIGTYMDRMAYLVEKHGGMVNDFLGDGLMANFGVPVASTTEQEMNRDASTPSSAPWRWARAWRS